MTLNDWYSVFQVGSVITLFLAFACGTGAIVTGLRVNKAGARQVLSLETRLAEAQAEAARATGSAEQEHIARLKIEQQLGPRTLSQEQQDRIATKLRAFANMSVFIIAWAGETQVEKTEAIGFATSIWAALRRAGIRAEAGWADGWPLQGIWLAYGSREISKRTSDLFSALLKALGDEGIDIPPIALTGIPSTGVMVLPETSLKESITPVDVRIMIGKKPQTILRK